MLGISGQVLIALGMALLGCVFLIKHRRSRAALGFAEPRYAHPLWGRLRFIINCLTRMRMLTSHEGLELNFSGSPFRARKNLTPWYEAEAPAWGDTRIVFGHWSALGLVVLPHLISLDTGCVWGRQLTAVRLDKRLPRVVQVEGQA